MNKSIYMKCVIALLLIHCVSLQNSAIALNNLENISQEELNALGSHKISDILGIKERFACNSFIHCIGFIGRKLMLKSNITVRGKPTEKNRSIRRIILLFGG